MKDENELRDEIARLQKEVDKLKATDLDNFMSSGRQVRSSKKAKRDDKPDWVKAWDAKNATGEVKHIVRTEENKTELLSPIVTRTYRRNPATGEVEEVVETAGLPDHLKLGVKHEQSKPALWDRPTDDAVAPHGLTAREAAEWLRDNPGKPMPDVEVEGPKAPVRKQMTRMNKVWKYRNFKKCSNCDAYDTWESRTDPNAAGPRPTHAEIWCHTCGATEFEVADSPPENVGTWSPMRESPEQTKDREDRRAYRETKTIEALTGRSMTPGELLVWFRTVERYEKIDLVMVEIMLRRLRFRGLVRNDESGAWAVCKQKQKKQKKGKS